MTIRISNIVFICVSMGIGQRSRFVMRVPSKIRGVVQQERLVKVMNRIKLFP